MNFTSRISTSHKFDDVIAELTKDCFGFYDWGMIFFSQYPYPQVQKITEAIQKRVSVLNFLGCTCAGIIGTNEEIEHRPGVSLILGQTPHVNVTPFQMNQAELEGLRSDQDWYHFLQTPPEKKPVFITLPDPFQFDMYRFIQGIKKAYGQAPIVGGLASAAMQANGNTLILNDQLIHDGLVGFTLTGDIRTETIVSQGCRPIGETYIVTKAERNVIYQLGGKTFLETLRKVFDRASHRDKLLAQEAIFVGMAMDEYKHEYGRGDFLIRMVMRIDANSGAGLIGDVVRPGQTVQFHVRDADSATEDLNTLLSLQVNTNAAKPKGALVFSCNGRGQNLFKEKNHDINLIQNQLGPIPAAGFFCAGEIGPVGGQNFLHGFTESIALFYPR